MARKKVTRKRRKTTARRAPARRRVRRKSNPRITARSVQNQVMEAGTGAIGALGLDVLQGYLPLPANFKTGIAGTAVKGLLAIGMGVVAQNLKFVRPATAARMANGALTVVLHDELKKQVQAFAPGIAMGEYLGEYPGSGYPAGYMPGMGEYMDPGMGTYLPDLATDDLGIDATGLGEYDGYMEDMSIT